MGTILSMSNGSMGGFRESSVIQHSRCRELFGFCVGNQSRWVRQAAIPHSIILVVDADDVDQDIGADAGDNEITAKPTRF